MQLNLFEWDLIAVGSAYASLANLDFENARRSFTQVLKTVPEHSRARRGMCDLQFWQDAFNGMERLDAESALRLGWQYLGRFGFDLSENHQLLWRNVLLHLLTLAAALPDFYDPPQLCGGYLLLQVGKFEEAERQLRLLLKARPHAGLLHLFLAEALWLQHKEELAGPSYAAALLLDPVEACRQPIGNPDLAHLCEERGPALAAVYGYIEGLLPLADVEGIPDSRESRIYAALRRAELSRREGDHREMIAARRELKDLAPEIFREYLEATKKNL